ncbi:LysR family transcriptional regulator [Sandaracinus amylolyticus]|nr:LysR family transcriptional regulator [Sandaracinus amylolyticus]
MREVDDVPSLDLLRCFVTLHRERHLSRAAIRLGLSQPAMSRALTRLRDAFDDPLFVRTPRGMVPTARADELAPRVVSVLEAAAALVRPTELDPAQLTRTFVVATSGFVDAQLLSRLTPLLVHEAPGVSITTRPNTDDLAESLASGRVDLMIGVSGSVPRDAHRTRLYEESWVCAVRRDHPDVGKRLSLERYAKLPHLLVAPGGHPGSHVDTALAARGLARRVVLRIHAFAPAPAIVAGSDLVVTAPRRIMEPLARPFGLRLFPPPIEIPGSTIVAAWHPRSQDDPAHAWFRAALVAAVKG